MGTRTMPAKERSHADQSIGPRRRRIAWQRMVGHASDLATDPRANERTGAKNAASVARSITGWHREQ
jgi:hypothetical protein